MSVDIRKGQMMERCKDCGGPLVQAFATTTNYLRCRRCGHVFESKEQS